MNTGLSLNQLAAELTRQTESRKDFLASQGAIVARVAEETGDIRIGGLPNQEPLALTPYAHGQLSDHLGIPKKYYDRMMAERPHLLAANINEWFQADAGNRRMLRTLDGRVRGVLSPKFRALDNFDLANATLPTLLDMKAEIVSAQLTETRMYIKAILPGLSDELPAGQAWGTGHNRVHAEGDVNRGKVVAAIVISNSDIGAGTLRVEPSVFTTTCTNLLIRSEAAMKKYHAGRANAADESWQVFADETRRADDAAFWMKVRDITRAAFDEKQFRVAIESLKAAAARPITGDINAVVEATVEQLALPPASQGGILNMLAKGGDLSQWGLSSAITRFAGETEDYEMATLLERAGGAVIDLKPTDWTRIAERKAA